MNEQTAHTETNDSRGNITPIHIVNTIKTPKLRTLDVCNEYKPFIMSLINENLESGSICAILNKTVLTTSATEDDCHFKDVTYWRLNRTDIVTDIEFELNLTVEGNNSDYTYAQTLYLSLWFCADDNFQPELYELSAEPQKFDAWRADAYLTPYLTKYNIDVAAEKVWHDYLPNAYKDVSLRTPEALAEKLRLSIKRLPLSESVKQNYLLFFEDGTVPVQHDSECGSKKAPEPTWQNVDAMTIVINTNAKVKGHGDFEIYQACFQYEWYFAFFRLNNWVSSNQALLTRSKPSESAERNPVSLMNSMCAKGALSLMLPRSIMEEKVFREYRKACRVQRCGYENHKGFRYHQVIYALSDEFGVMRFHIRQRLVQMGKIEARGANNYDPDLKRSFPPFCFDPNAIDIEDDFYIRRMQLWSIYNKDSAFRDMMKAGDYAFVDGVVCLNSPEFLEKGAIGTKLTRAANANVDKCCLRFTKTYTAGEQNTAFNSEKHQSKYQSFLSNYNTYLWEEHKENTHTLLEQMPNTFSEALKYLMNRNSSGRIDNGKLAKYAGLSETYISQLCDEPKTLITKQDAVSLCVAMHLTPDISYALIQRAGIFIPEQSIYSFILSCLYMESVSNIKAFLKANKFEVETIPFEAVS